MPNHCQFDIDPPHPPQFGSKGVWVKGDMVNAVGFHRLDFIRIGKTKAGKRKYRYTPLSGEIIKRIQGCVLSGLGLDILTKHIP